MAPSAVEALQKLFSAEQLALAGTDEYRKLNSSYLSSLESEIAPAAIFLPKTADDVSIFITTIKDFALDVSARFASKSFSKHLQTLALKTDHASKSAVPASSPSQDAPTFKAVSRSTCAT